MGILCCRPRRGDDEESQPLLKEGGQHIGNQTLDEDERRGSIFIGSGYDENSVLQVILERTAKLVVGQQSRIVNIDPNAGENNLPVAALENSDANTLIDTLNAPSPYTDIKAEVDADTEAVAQKVTSFELKDVGDFVVELDPIT